MNRILLTFLCIALTWTAARADEGMWLFTQLPIRQLKEKYKLDPTPALLDQMQKSTVMIGRGSGAFVSADGLVLTNHHVAMEALQELSNAGPDLLEQGFLAAKRGEERRCPDIELRALWSVEDVTERVLRAIKPDMSLAEAATARAAAVHAIEDESWRNTKLVSEVTTLYHGARYHLHCYKNYTDVRLVFAPETVVTQFFDVCLLRAYEDGKPARVAHHLSWGGTPAETDDLILAAGYPGSTDRLRTSADLEHTYGPLNFMNIKMLSRRRQVVEEFAKAYPDKKPLLRNELHRLQHGTYALMGHLDTQEKYLARQRTREEFELVALLTKDPEAGKRRRAALERIARSLKENAGLTQSEGLLESAAAFHTPLFDYARQLVRWADESGKPNAERLAGYREADAESVKRAILRPRTIVKDLEARRLADSLDVFARYAGRDEELAAQILDGKSPTERARELIKGTQLDQAEVRQTLLEGGPKAIHESKDSMILLARLVDPHARRVAREYREKLSEPCDQAYAVLAQNRLDTLAYPDATHTLRLSYGKVLHVDEVKRRVGARANMHSFADLCRYLKKTAQEEMLPQRWQTAWGRLSESQTPLVLVTSVDGSPGSSGSPFVDRAGRVVAVAAWGMSMNDFSYVEEESGCAGVGTNAIVEVLDSVYRATELVKELVGDKLVAKAQPAPPKSVAPPLAPDAAPPPVMKAPGNGPLPLPDWAKPSVVPGALPSPSALGIPPTAGDVKPAVYLPTIPSVPWVASSGETSVVKRHKELALALMNALKNDDQEVRTHATTALTNLGKDAVPYLVEALQGKDAWMRDRALLILARMGPAGESAIPDLVKALDHPEVQVRRHVAYALSKIVAKTSP